MYIVVIFPLRLHERLGYGCIDEHTIMTASDIEPFIVYSFINGICCYELATIM